MAKRSERIWRRFEQLGLDSWHRMSDSLSWATQVDGTTVMNAIESGKLDGIAIILPYTVSGDYIGSRVETSNCQELLKAYPDTVWERHEGYGSSMAMVWLRDMVAVLSEAHEHHGLVGDLESLQHYPVLDEEAMSELEMDDMMEGWTSWAQSDLMAEIWELIQPDDDDERDYHDLLPIELGDIGHAAWDYGHAEGCGWYFDIRRIARHIVEESPSLIRWEDGSLVDLVNQVTEGEG